LARVIGESKAITNNAPTRLARCFFNMLCVPSEMDFRAAAEASRNRAVICDGTVTYDSPLESR
jgi:hypothetical protein